MAKTQKQKREDALDLYLNTDLSQKQICDIVGWSERTFTTNKEKHLWQALKDAQSVSTNAIIGNLYKHAARLSEADEIDADKLIKIANSIEKLSDKKVTLSHIINVFKEFTHWAIAENRDFARKVNELQQKFIVQKVNE